MENMKRAISAFMALVLVLGMLPGVPMFAGAEEVETQPETVAVETTEAATLRSPSVRLSTCIPDIAISMPHIASAIMLCSLNIISSSVLYRLI